MENPNPNNPHPSHFSGNSSREKGERENSPSHPPTMNGNGVPVFTESSSSSSILFLTMNSGEMIGIDLSRSKTGNNGSCNCNWDDFSHPPPYAPACVFLDLQYKGYPFGMRHFQFGGKHYFCGGAIKPDHYYVGPAEKYSDQVFQLHLDLLSATTTVIKDPKAVLKPLTTPRLLEPKFPFIVANIKGSVYLIHDGFWFYNGRPPHIPFERLDYNNNNNGQSPSDDSDAGVPPPPISCHQLPTPPFIRPFKSFIPFNSEVYGHFVFDHKLVILCSYDVILTFTPPSQQEEEANVDGKWESVLTFWDVNSSFNKLSGAPVPETGLGLPPDEFCLDVDGDSLGVLLAFQMFELDDGSDSGHSIFAYAISKTTLELKFCQYIDFQVLFDILRDPRLTANPVNTATETHHLLDLGKGDEEGSRRICAIFAGDCMDDIPCLFVSIFDVRMNTSASFVKDDNFLSVSPPIKKLAFRMDMEKEGFMFYDNPILDAFLI